MMNMNLQFFAHKKGVGSTKNGRDSESKRLGIGGDDTLFALTDGILRFERKGKDKKQASVYPVAE